MSNQNNNEKLASNKQIDKTASSLRANGINVTVVANGYEAKAKVLELIPNGAEVMTASSTTLIQLGLDEILNNSSNYNSVKSQLLKLNRDVDSLKMQKIGAAPEYVAGSVHAVTEDGKVMIASGSGSQLPSYSYGSPNVIWVVSTKKIVKDTGEGLKRIYDHVLPQEDNRMKKVYGPDASSEVRKLLIINKEINPTRLNMILVKENLGF